MWRVCFVWKPNPHMPSIELIYIISVHTSPLAIIFVQRFSNPNWSKFVKLPRWWFQPLWNILINWDYYSQYMEKYKKCSKPATRKRSNYTLHHFAMPFPVLYQALNSQLSYSKSLTQTLWRAWHSAAVFAWVTPWHGFPFASCWWWFHKVISLDNIIMYGTLW